MNIIKRIGIVLSMTLMTISGFFGQNIEKDENDSYHPQQDQEAIP